MNKSRKMGSSSAGIGDPYWYEWGIGLLKAIEMLNPDSEVEAVAFQMNGVKGWDDIVIRFRSGRREYYQVKHSRPRSNLTFSDLIGKSDDKVSLLSSLSTAWRDMGLGDKDSSCILITNRQAGTRASRSKNGTYYPPLSEFLEHVTNELTNTSTLEDVSVKVEWQAAWELWKSEMSALSDNEKLDFMRAVTVSTDAPQLDEMSDILAATLATLLGITDRQAEPLVKNLLSALFKWTTSLRGDEEWINGEDIMASLAESEPEIFGYCDVPTPVPFFPSREKTVEAITGSLTNNEVHRVVFLEANPGAGKTSVVSRIVNQRAQDFSTLIVDIRYYAYKPITPDSPAIPVDADSSASPESLWYSLLSQIRERLVGRILELSVPVRNHFIRPDEARDHVLRLAAILAQEKQSPFVIVIDGIDHAARAHRKGLPSLLSSMPAPESIPKGVRFLIAGQPASGYPEYPIWLRKHHELVDTLSLGPIEEQDIQLLLSHSTTSLSPETLNLAARNIQEAANGNTLAAVFSVAEAENCKTLSELEERLSSRQLHSGVHAYYRAIWEVAIPNSPQGIAAYLSSVLCILRQRVTGEIMHEAFPAWDKSAPEWDAILKSLMPLVIRDENGYRVRHNDIRVFLESELRTDDAALQQVASQLADYYMGTSADPFFKQQSIFTLLKLAGRTTDTVHIFDPKWVLDAAAYGRDLSTIYAEAEDAFLSIPEAKDWDAALSVACGGFTLNKLSDCLDQYPDISSHTREHQASLPQCLETERFVPPFNSWDANTINQVISDTRILIERKEVDRARGLMTHWFSEVKPMDIVTGVEGVTDNQGLHDETTLASGIDTLFKDWGAFTFILGIELVRGDPTEPVERHATYLFEKGWVTECIQTLNPDNVSEAIKKFRPIYLNTYETAVEKAAKRRMWKVVGEFLNILLENKGKLELDFKIKAAYWALNAVGEHAATEWTEIIQEARTGISSDTSIDMPLMLYVAKVIGWLEPHREATEIASELADGITQRGRRIRDKASILISLRAAAIIGLIERMRFKNSMNSAATLVRPQAIQYVIEQIWKNLQSTDFYEMRHQARTLTFQLIKLCQEIGGSHAEMVLTLSLSEAERFPVDQKMPVLWEVLRRAGHREILKNWAEHWIGENGAVWSKVDFSERVEIVSDLSRLVREEGWTDLAVRAETRQRHRIIGYSSHKEYSLGEPLEWLKELFLIEPNAWHEEGLQLLAICLTCEEQGGDNRLDSAIEEEVASASFRCGPSNAWSFFSLFNPKSDSYWLQSLRRNLISASQRVISECVISEPDDILVLWSCAVGLSRWFDRHQAQTLTAFRDEILASAQSETRAMLEEQMRILAPGEFLREEYDKDRQKAKPNKKRNTSGDDITDLNDAISGLNSKVEQGYEPSLKEIASIAIRIAFDNPTNRTELLRGIFKLIDENRSYISAWGYWVQDHPLREVLSILREDESWELMRAAVRPVGRPYWLLSASHNVHTTCLFHAASNGVELLKRGTHSLFEMHHLWAGMNDKQRNRREVSKVIDTVESWPDFTAHVLRQLLTSDSAETVSAALRGLCAVVEVAPSTLTTIFTNANDKLRSILLFGSEVWACRHPNTTTTILDEIRDHRNLSMHDKIQLWICKLVQADGEERVSESFLPRKSFRPTDSSSFQIYTKPRKFLEINPQIEGSVQLANTFSAARNFISRFGQITGIDTEDLESEIAERLEKREQEPVADMRRYSRDYFATEDGDMLISRKVDTILDEALEYELNMPGWSETDKGNIAIAVMHGDDPWVLRGSPLPSPASFDWPEEKEVNEWLRSRVDKANVLNRLKLLARGEDLTESQVTLGSSLRLFTSDYDLEMMYWLESVSSGDIEVKNTPFSPCGRSFQFFLTDRFEPHTYNRFPLVFFSRSSLFLSFSTIEVVPTKIFQDSLGWKPKHGNPLEWELDGRVVAKYEMYHGPLNYNWGNRHMRQPTLSRWVVNADELDKLTGLQPQWEFESHSFITG